MNDNVTRAKHVGTGTINVRKQCGMRSRYAVKHGGSTRVKMPFEHEKIPFGLSNSNMNDLWSLVFQKKIFS